MMFRRGDRVRVTLEGTFAEYETPGFGSFYLTVPGTSAAYWFPKTATIEPLPPEEPAGRYALVRVEYGVATDPYLFVRRFAREDDAERPSWKPALVGSRRLDLPMINAHLLCLWTDVIEHATSVAVLYEGVDDSHEPEDTGGDPE